MDQVAQARWGHTLHGVVVLKEATGDVSFFFCSHEFLLSESPWIGWPFSQERSSVIGQEPVII